MSDEPNVNDIIRVYWFNDDKTVKHTAYARVVGKRSNVIDVRWFEQRHETNGKLDAIFVLAPIGSGSKIWDCLSVHSFERVTPRWRSWLGATVWEACTDDIPTPWSPEWEQYIAGGKEVSDEDARRRG